MESWPPHATPPLWQRLLIGRRPQRTLLRAIGIALLSVVVFRFVLLPIRVTGISMAPTYTDGRISVVNTAPYWWRTPRRGEVVAIRLAGRSIMFLKRIVGLPGESIRIDDGIVFVNNRALAETYVRWRSSWKYAEVTLAPGEYFVIGDNRSMNQEEHTFGRVTRTRIVGKTL